MTVAITVVAAALLAVGFGTSLPGDGRTWSAIGRAVRRRLDVVVTDDRRLRRVAWALAVLGALVAVAGAVVPGALVGGVPAALVAVRGRRRERRRRALARSASLVARAVADGLDAGHGVRRAITDAARTGQIEPPAGDELRSVAARLDAGDPLPAALDGWRRRTGEPAHATLVAGLLLHGEAGGELANVLRGQATALDRSRRQAAEAESAIVQARAAARIVGGIPAVVGLAVVVFAPGAARQMTATIAGTALVTMAVGLQIVAVIVVRRLAAEPR